MTGQKDTSLTLKSYYKDARHLLCSTLHKYGKKINVMRISSFTDFLWLLVDYSNEETELAQIWKASGQC